MEHGTRNGEPGTDTGNWELGIKKPRLQSPFPVLYSFRVLYSVFQGQTTRWLRSAKEKDLLDALNKARQDNGLAPVAADAKLTCAARMHATDFAGGCDHTGSDGSRPWDRAQKSGFLEGIAVWLRDDPGMGYAEAT